MTVRVVRLGSDRLPGEGLRFGTVRRPPRGVSRSEYSSRNFYDVWLPTLAPRAETINLAQGATYPSVAIAPMKRVVIDLCCARCCWSVARM